MLIQGGVIMTNHKLQKSEIIAVKDLGDDIFMEISVQGAQCLLKTNYDEKARLCESRIICQTEDEANICKAELARFIRTGDSNNLNWYIGMDYNDVYNFFFGKELQFFHFKEDLSSIDDLAKKINAQFPDNSDLLIYADGASVGIALFDNLHFSRWIQFSNNESANEIKVSVWHNVTVKAD